MNAKTEELLYFLLWSAEALTQPTFRNLNASYESWAYRRGFVRQIARLEKRRLVEGRVDSGARIYRLTESGCLRALGGRDPTAQWSRPWDGRWRLVLFDLPITQNSARARLRRNLRDKGFGCMQKSVWITPDKLDQEVELLGGRKVDVKGLTLFEAIPCSGESNADIVSGAWDFDRINHFYEKHQVILSKRPTGKNAKAHLTVLRRWAATERTAWLQAVTADPLLPQELLPAKYLGRQAWQQRIRVLGKVRQDLDKVAF